MNVLNFFKFLEDKEGKVMPSKAKLLDPEYVFNIEDFRDKYGDIKLEGTQITSLNTNNLNVKGHLILNNCKKLQSLPNNLVVNGLLSLINCTNLQSLPNNLKVGGSIFLRDTPISKKYTADKIKQMYPEIEGKIYGAKERKNIWGFKE